MSNHIKYIWVLYQVTDETTLASSAGLPDPETHPIENYCEAIFVAERSLEDTNGIRMLGVWDAQAPKDTINKKAVDRIA